MVDYFDIRRDIVLLMADGRERTTSEIADRLSKHKLCVRSTAAHLTYLRKRGLLKRTPGAADVAGFWKRA